MIDENRILSHLKELEVCTIPHPMYCNGRQVIIDAIREGLKNRKYDIRHHDVEKYYKD